MSDLHILTMKIDPRVPSSSSSADVVHGVQNHTRVPDMLFSDNELPFENNKT